MKKIISVICAVVFLLSSVSVSAFALTKTDADADLAAQNKTFNDLTIGKMDVNASGKIDAGDARAVLLCSAGLEENGINKANADIDKDGKVTAIDARIFLRMSAKLEKPEKYYNVSDAQKLSYFTSIINSIKPNSYAYYQSAVDTTEKIDYNDKNGVIADINRQFSIYADMDESMKGFNFGDELKASVGDKYSPYLSNITTSRKIQNSNYPVKDNDLAFLATIDDVKKIEYKTNETCEFAIYNSALTSLRYKDTITNLDSITVYLKDDAKLSLTGNADAFNNTYAGKALDVLSVDEIDEDIVGDLGLDSITGMEDLGKCEITMTPKTLQYHDCYVKVYFYPETGIPVATEHNLNYTIGMNMDLLIDFDPSNLTADIPGMDIIFDIILRENKGKILYVDGDFDLNNTMSTKTCVYLYQNNPNHITFNDYQNNK